MKLIPIGGGAFAMVDDRDFDRLSAFKWRLKNGYAITGIECTRMHRLIVQPEGGLDVDHRDTNRLNNQRGNLRPATRAQNIQNSRPRVCARKTSKYKGVNWNAATGKWRARIKAGSRHIALGCYLAEIEAAKAYDRAALQHFGEFARLNLSQGDISCP